jgi:hypothetical protein
MPIARCWWCADRAQQLNRAGAWGLENCQGSSDKRLEKQSVHPLETYGDPFAELKGSIMTGKIFIALNKIEAETNWSRGHLREAMEIYTKLLASSPDMTLNTRTAVEARIRLLREELDRPAQRQDGQDVEAAIRKLQAAMAVDGSIANLRKAVKNFYRDGLYADALESLKQLTRRNAADEFCINAVAGCLLHLYSIADLPVAVDLYLVESFQNAEKAAQFKLLLAEKLAHKGYKKHAEALQRHQDRFGAGPF